MESRTRNIYSTETHTSDFIFNTFWNGKPVQFLQERCWVVVAGCQENESCSKVLYFLEMLDDRIRCTHEETVAVVKLWENIGSNKSLGGIFNEKSADWMRLSSKQAVWQIFMTCFFMDRLESWMTPRFLAESEMGMLWEPRVIESGRETVEGLKEDKNGKRRASVLSSLSLIPLQY